MGVIALLLAGLNVNAQPWLSRGYIVTNQNDTLKGFISDRGNIGNAKACYFKPTKKSKTTRYLPNELKSYRFIDGKYYKSLQVIESDTQKTAFTEVLLESKVTLCKYWKNKEFRYYLLNEEGETIPLPDVYNTVTFSDYPGLSHRVEIDSYKDSLRAAFSACGKLAPNIKELEYTGKDLIDITKQYIDCANSDHNVDVYEKDYSQSTISFGVFSGMKLSKIALLESAITSNFSTAIPYGLFVNFPIPFINERISFQTELMASRNEYNNGFANVPSIYKDITVRSAKISMPLMIRYKFGKKKLQPSIGIGKELAYIFNSEVKTTPVSFDFEVPGSQEVFEYRQRGFFVHFSQRQSWFADLGLDYRISNKFSVYSNLRFQTNLNLIIEEKYYNNYMFTVAEKKNRLNNPHSNVYRTYSGALFLGIRF